MQQEAMEDDKNNPKYAKLLAEYSKLRAQAKVLKNAVVEERNRTSVLQESMRIKDQNLRRAESELDSQNFRNKQMERRIESLQNDLQAYQQKGTGGGSKASKMRDNQLSSGIGEVNPIIIEELQRRIIENAQFASTISDKNNEIEMYTNRIKDLELQVAKQMHDHAEAEKRLRKDVEVLMAKNTEIETKIIEVTSQMGSEGDTTSLASDSTMPLHALLGASNNSHIDDRIAFLEKELNHYRTQYELLKINDALRMDEHLITASSQAINNHMSFSQPQQQRKVLSSQSSTSTTSSMSNTNNNHSTFVNYPTSSQSSGSKSSPCLNSKSLPEPSTSLKCDDDQNSEPMNRDQMVYEVFSKRFEELFQEKCKAESKVINYVTECESLKNNIEILVQDLEEKDKMLNESQASFVRLEEDFLTTRVNYMDQICVLTDQVISLSDQLSSR